MKDEQKREEPPRQAAQLITKTNDPVKDTTPVTVDRELAVDRLAHWAARGRP